jgi:hypothetical protein
MSNVIYPHSIEEGHKHTLADKDSDAIQHRTKSKERSKNATGPSRLDFLREVA